MTFAELEIGSIFNTKAARFEKISDDKARVVMSSLYKVGSIIDFTNQDVTIIPLKKQ